MRHEQAMVVNVNLLNDLALKPGKAMLESRLGLTGDELRLQVGIWPSAEVRGQALLVCLQNACAEATVQRKQAMRSAGF